LIIFESIILLSLARLAIYWLPFRWIVKILGTQHAETTETGENPDTDRILRIGRLIRLVSRNLPWDCKCLAQAITGKIMLSRRGIKSTVYFGVAKGEDDPLKAHAWLRSGIVYVTGGRGHRQFTVITTFADKTG